MVIKQWNEGVFYSIFIEIQIIYIWYHLVILHHIPILFHDIMISVFGGC